MGIRATCVAIVAASLAAAIACSSKHPNTGDAGSRVDGAPPADGTPPAGDALGGDAGLCGAAVCTADACGSGSACGQPVSCAMCRYDATTISSSFGSLVVAVGSGAAPPLAVAYGTTIATRSGSSWSTEQISDPMGGIVEGSAAGFALGADGTRWVSLIGGGQAAVTIAHGSGSAGWTLDTVGTTQFGGGALAIASDGTVGVVFVGSAPGIQDGIILAHASASAGAPWTLSTILPTESFPSQLAIAADPNGGFGIAWQSGGVSYVTATTAGAPGPVETVDAAAAATSGDAISLAYDGADRPHVAYRHDVPNDRGAYHAVRDSGTWTTEIFDGNFGESYIMHLAAGPSGGLAILYNLDDGLYLAQHVNGVWLRQPLYGECDGGGGGLAYVGGTLEAVHDCGDALVELVRDGTYPADYAATCAHAAAALCSSACACGASCCIDENAGQVCADPIGNCEKFVGVDLCGDPTRDPSELSSCDAAVATAPTCGSDSAIAAPAACVFP